MLFLSNTTATLALVVEQRRRMMGKASVALVVRKGFVYRSEHTLGRRDHSSFLSRRRDLQTAASSTRVVLPALDRHRSPRAPLICPENAALSSRRRRCVSQLRPWGSGGGITQFQCPNLSECLARARDRLGTKRLPSARNTILLRSVGRPEACPSHVRQYVIII
jgi:hypothetical protein